MALVVGAATAFAVARSSHDTQDRLAAPETSPTVSAAPTATPTTVATATPTATAPPAPSTPPAVVVTSAPPTAKTTTAKPTTKPATKPTPAATKAAPAATGNTTVVVGNTLTEAVEVQVGTEKGTLKTFTVQPGRTASFSYDSTLSSEHMVPLAVTARPVSSKCNDGLVLDQQSLGVQQFRVLPLASGGVAGCSSNAPTPGWGIRLVCHGQVMVNEQTYGCRT